MGKKRKASTKAPIKPVSNFDPDRTKWFSWAVLGIFLLGLVVLFRSFLFSDRMLYGSDTIQAGIFFRSFLIDHFWSHGGAPQWNPFIFGGMPYVEAFHGDIFYPLSFLKLFGSIFRMLGFILILHIFLAGLFMYLCARQFGLSKIPSLMAAGVYMYAGWLVSLVAPGHDGKIFVTALFPLVMLFLSRAFDERRGAFINFSMLGLVLGVIILSPHPQMSYYTLWVVAAYTIFRLVSKLRDTGSVKRIIKPGALSAYAVVLGLLVSAIQFYPGYVYTSQYSPRADSKSGWEWATSWSLHEEEAMSVLIPEFSGTNSRSAKTVYWGKNAFKDNSESVGATAILLALVGIFFYRRRESYFLGGVALFALVYALGATTPIFKIFFYLIPKVESLRAPSMIMFLFSFSVSLLAGMGVQYFINQVRKNSTDRSVMLGRVLFGFSGAMLLGALLMTIAGKGMLDLWCWLFYPEASTTLVRQGVSKLDLAYMNLPAIQSGIWFAFFFSGLASVVTWMYYRRRAGISILLLLLAIPMIDGIRFDSRFVDTVDERTVSQWRPNVLTDFLKAQPGKFRVLNYNVMPADLLPYFGIEVVTGYHGNQLRWYDELIGGPRQTERINPRLLNLLGVKYIIARGNDRVLQGAFGPLKPYPVLNLGGPQVYQNDNAFPRVYLADKFEVIADRKQIHSLVTKSDRDLRSDVLLEEDPQIELTAGSDGTDSAWIVAHDIDSVMIGLICKQNHLLVLVDNYYDAWQVTIDGQPGQVLRAYGSFRAVAIRAGTSQVLFKYNSKRYATGKMVSYSALGYLGLVGAVFWWRRRRDGAIEEVSET